MSIFRFRQRDSLFADADEFGAVRAGSQMRETGRAPESKARASYTDPRLRGIDPNTVGRPIGQKDAYDISSARYAVTMGDPYEQVARQQEDLGQRMPLPYQAPSALAGMPSLTGRPVADSAIYENLHSDSVVNPAASVAGMRQTQAGTFGARTDTSGGPWWDARHRFGYGEMKSRGAGYDERWDTKSGEERTAGRLEQPTTFDQEVMQHRPYLRIFARGDVSLAEGQYNGNAIFKVIAGNYQHGASEIRRFWVGGGTVAAFDLRGWDSVRIELEELIDGSFAEFAWTERGLEGQHRSLLYPDAYVSSGTTIAVPEGAWSVSIEDPGGGGPTTLEWIGRRAGNTLWTFTDIVTAPGASNIYYGQRIEVKAPTFKMDTSGDITWWLRPI